MTNASYTATLLRTIETSPIPQAVVDYTGRHDGDGIVAKGDPLTRVYGTRDMRHVVLYGLKVVHLNKAARKQAA